MQGILLLATALAMNDVAQRAAALPRCFAESVQKFGLHAACPRGCPDVFENGELHLCPPIEAGFVHIFKSAGTSLGVAFRQLCDTYFGPNTAVVQCNGGPTCDPIAWETRRYRFFSFTRDVKERFLSAMYEVDRHSGLKHTAAPAAPAAFIRHVLHDVMDSSLSDAHFDPQVAFLVQGGAIVPRLTHLGRVEHLETDMVTIATELFNATPATTVAADTRRALADRYRDRHDANYSGSRGVAALRVEDMDSATRAAMRRAFLVDVRCLAAEPPSRTTTGHLQVHATRPHSGH